MRLFFTYIILIIANVSAGIFLYNTFVHPLPVIPAPPSLSSQDSANIIATSTTNNSGTSLNTSGTEKTEISTGISKKQSVTSTSTTSKNISKNTKVSSRPAASDKQVTSTQQTTPISPNSASNTQPSVQLPPLDFEKINTLARGSIVNIFCTVKNSGTISPITGSGVVIDSRGIILTNAHIGQYFLLKDWQIQNFISCVVRTGSPAYPRYNVELVYISPTWVENNKTILKEASPKGTGENDFAFLRITSKIDGTSVEPLPYTPVNIRDVIESGETVDLVSYPAGFLGGQSISQDLNLSSALTKVGEIFTFSADTIDLISVPGTVVSQKGASGGGVFDANGTLIGIITTSSDSKTTGERDLRAITLGYINRVLEKETGDSISKFLSKDVARYAADFQANTAPLLAKIIEDAISK